METLNIEWLNENVFRNYPIVDGASRQSLEGAVLPNGLIVDLKLSVPFGMYPTASFFVHSVQGIGAGAIISFASFVNPGTVLASATVLMSHHKQYTSYPVVGMPNTPCEGYVGKIVIGTLEAVQQCSKNIYTFTHEPTNTSIVVSCIEATHTELQKLIVVTPEKEHVITAKTVRFIAGENVILHYNDDTGVLTISSKVTVTPSELATALNTCKTSGIEEFENAAQGACIKTINNIPPDNNGNFNLQFSGGIQMQNINGNLTLVDTSAKPCCTNEHVQTMYQNINIFEKARSQLLSAVEQLNARVSNLAAVIISSGMNLCAPKNEDQSSITWIFNSEDGSIVPGD